MYRLYLSCSGEELEWECKLALHVRVCVSLSLLSRVATLGCVCVWIVEIEERDFYFEISPADYQDEEANIRKNSRKIRKA